MKTLRLGRKCHQNHQYCQECYPQGCVLCRFLELRSSKVRLDNSSRVVETCTTWERIFHKQKFAPLSGSNYDEQSPMEIDMPSASTSTSPSNSSRRAFERHRFQFLSFFEDVNSTDDNKCAICFDEMNSADLPFKICQHRFHQSCLEQWFQSSGKKSCPTCGKIYEITKGYFIQSLSQF